MYFRYDTRYIIDCWNLDVIIVPVEEKMRWSETCMPDDVLNLPNLEAGGVVRIYLPNVDGLLGQSDQCDSWQFQQSIYYTCLGDP